MRTVVMNDETLITWQDHDSNGEWFEASVDDLKELVRCGEAALEDDLDREDRESVVELTGYFQAVLLQAELELIGGDALILESQPLEDQS
jgi:hypothetical protein